jgi:hypothetical protein
MSLRKEDLQRSCYTKKVADGDSAPKAPLVAWWD